MYYFDLVRLRSSLRVFAYILAGFVAFVLISIPFSHAGNGDTTIGINGEAVRLHDFHGYSLLHELGRRIVIPFSIVCAVAAGITVVYATTFSTSLSRVNGNLHLWFTRPVSRERSTLLTIALDAIAIALGFAIALVALTIPIAAVGLLDRIRFDGDCVRIVLAGLSVAYMWYALVQAVTAGFRSRAAVVLGLSWPTFIVLHSLSHLDARILPGFLVAAIDALDVLNPLAYANLLSIDFSNQSANASTTSFLPMWVAIVVALAIAVVVRKRMEV
jgi:hypothetical protein